MMASISDVAVLLRNGKSVQQSADAGGLPITRIETIADWTVNQEKVGFADLRREDCEDWLLQNGDILISHINSTKHLGKCAMYEGVPSELVHGMNLLALRVDKELADARFIYRMLASPGFRSQLPQITKDSVNQSSFNISNFKKLQIPLPPLAEQKRIASILDAADALRAKRRESLAQLDTLLQSTFLDLFGDCGRFVSIGELLADGKIKLHKDGNHGSLYPRADEFVEHGVPFLSAKCISEDGSLLPSEVQYLSEEKAQKLKIGWIEKGDVLLAHNASVGKTCLYLGEYGAALIGTSLTAFRPNPQVLDSGFLLGALRSQAFQQLLFSNMGQTTRNQVPITAQRRLTIPIPSLELQRRYASIVESVKQQKARLRAHLTELDTLFASLQQRAFNGDL